MAIASRSPVISALHDFALAHHTALTAVGILVALFVYQSFLYPLYFSKLRHLPGPPFGHWLFGQIGPILEREAGLLQSEWVEKYAGKDGNVVRAVGPFGIERLIFCSPNAAEQILVKDVYDFPRPHIVRGVLGQVTGFGLLTVEGDDHRSMRRMMQPAFSQAHLSALVPEFYPPIEVCKSLFHKAIDEQALKGDDADSAIIDVYEAMSHCTLDIICETAFGYTCDCQRNPENPLAVNYERLINLQNGPNLGKMFIVVSIPYGTHLIGLIKRIPIKAIAGPLGELDAAMKEIKKVAHKMLMDKTRSVTGEEAQGGKDVLSLLVKANRGEDGKNFLSEEQMMDQVLTFLGAGHETTATGMTWTLWLLACHPECQKRLRDEVADLLGRKMEPTMDDLNGLPYLEAVVKESLRVMPPVPATMRISRVDKVVDGVFVPKGTLIYMGNRVMNMLPQLWGEDAKEFKPERWLDLKDGTTPGGSRYAFQSFIHGAHNCIGGAMAQLEMKAMVVHLFANFEFSLPPDYKKPVPKAAITMKPESGLPLRVRRIKTFANAISEHARV